MPKIRQRWIEIVDWERFQHYTNRDPVWIKNYTRLMADDSYLSLTGNRRALLHGLWLQYALSGTSVRLDVKMINTWIKLNIKMSDLEALKDAGFIRFRASRPLAKRYGKDRDRSKDLKVFTETDSPELPISKNDQGPTPAHPLTDRLLAEIRDANERTADTLRKYETKLPEAAFANALESLKLRRKRTDRPPLASEARYVVATLNTIERERTEQK